MDFESGNVFIRTFYVLLRNDYPQLQHTCGKERRRYWIDRVVTVSSSFQSIHLCSDVKTRQRRRFFPRKGD